MQPLPRCTSTFRAPSIRRAPPQTALRPQLERQPAKLPFSPGCHSLTVSPTPPSLDSRTGSSLLLSIDQRPIPAPGTGRLAVSSAICLSSPTKTASQPACQPDGRMDDPVLQHRTRLPWCSAASLSMRSYRRQRRRWNLDQSLSIRITGLRISTSVGGDRTAPQLPNQDGYFPKIRPLLYCKRVEIHVHVDGKLRSLSAQSTQKL
eukprot:COSAG02_NODE_4540_length_5235_cov_4.163357_6_plen_205_part_00